MPREMKTVYYWCCRNCERLKDQVFTPTWAAVTDPKTKEVKPYEIKGICLNCGPNSTLYVKTLEVPA